MSDLGTIARGPAAEIKSYVDRIERVEGERKDLAGDVKGIYVEAKGRGYNPKALRKVIAQRRQKTDEEMEADIERYRCALGMPGATYRSVAEELGVTKSTLHRLVPNTSRGTRPMVDADLGEWLPAHDVETGELPREMTDDDLGSLDVVIPTTVREMEADDIGDPLLITNQFRAKVKAIAAGVKSQDGPVIVRNTGGDDDAGQLNPPTSTEVARAAPPAITDAKAFLAMDEAHERLQAMKRARGLVA